MANEPFVLTAIMGIMDVIYIGGCIMFVFGVLFKCFEDDEDSIIGNASFCCGNIGFLVLVTGLIIFLVQIWWINFQNTSFAKIFFVMDLKVINLTLTFNVPGLSVTVAGLAFSTNVFKYFGHCIKNVNKFCTDGGQRSMSECHSRIDRIFSTSK